MSNENDYVNYPVEQAHPAPANPKRKRTPSQPVQADPNFNQIQGGRIVPLPALPQQPPYQQPPQYQQGSYQGMPAPRVGLVQNFMNKIAGQKIPQQQYQQPQQQPDVTEIQQQNPTLTRVQAAIVVLQEVSQSKRTALLGIVGMLVATGVGTLLQVIGLFGYVIPMGFLVYFMWKFIQSDKKVKYLRYQYGI